MTYLARALLVMVLLAPLSVRAYDDPRDPASSKAKGEITQLRNKLTELEQGLENPDRTIAKEIWVTNRYKNLEQLFERVAKRDPEWDLAKEKAFFADVQKKIDAFRATQKQANMEGSEPDPELGVVTPLAGAPTIAAKKPDWCDGVTLPALGAAGAGGASAYVMFADQLGDLRLIANAAQLACRAPDFDKRQRWAAAWRQTLANATGADDKLITRLYRVAMQMDGNKKAHEAMCAPYHEKKAAGQREATGDQVAWQRAMGIAIGCSIMPTRIEADDGGSHDLLWWIDRRIEPPSQLAAAMFILTQAGAAASEAARRKKTDWTEPFLRHLGGFALVVNDIERLDEATFKAELAAMNLPEHGQVMAELTFRRAQHLGKLYAAAYADMSPEIRELAFTAPKRAFAAWEKAYGEHKAAMDLVYTVEQAAIDGKPTAAKDCADRTLEAFGQYVSSAAKGLADEDAKKAVLRDAIATRLLESAVVCAVNEGRLGMAAALHRHGLDRGREWRGPRTAGFFAMLESYGELKAKDPRTPLKSGHVAYMFKQVFDAVQDAVTRTHNKTAFTAVEEGRIKAVKKTAQGVELVFQTESWQQPTYKCTETNKVDRIDANGALIYRQHCVETGVTTVTSTVKPYTVPAVLAGGLEAGMTLKSSVENQTGGRVGTPIEARSEGKKGKLVAMLGARL